MAEKGTLYLGFTRPRPRVVIFPSKMPVYEKRRDGDHFLNVNSFLERFAMIL